MSAHYKASASWSLTFKLQQAQKDLNRVGILEGISSFNRGNSVEMTSGRSAAR